MPRPSGGVADKGSDLGPEFRIKRSKIGRVVTLAFGLVPVVLLGGWVAYLSLTTPGGVRVRLPIKDLTFREGSTEGSLSFSIDYGVPSDRTGLCAHGGAGSERVTCLCLEKIGDRGLVRVAGAATCREVHAEVCDGVLVGRCERGAFVAGIEHFALGESVDDSALAIAPPHPVAEVELSPSGRGVVSNILVGELPLLQWVRQKKVGFQ